MKKSILIVVMLLLVNVVPVSAYTGKSVMCHKIGYLSTSCGDVEVLPLEYVDRDIAIEKARSGSSDSISYNNVTNVNVQPEETKYKKAIGDDGVMVTYEWTEE